MTSNDNRPRRAGNLPGLTSLLVAGAGTARGPRGLFRFTNEGTRWAGGLLAPAADLSALAAHPHLRVVYGVAGDDTGLIHAWRLGADRAHQLNSALSGGVTPCHVSVDPAGVTLVVCNYSSANVTAFALLADGSIGQQTQSIRLEGSSIDPERQAEPHPHQATFSENGTALIVADLGADALHIFDYKSAYHWFDRRGLFPTPPGTGPRHMAISRDGAIIAVSAELAGTVLLSSGALCGDSTSWEVTPSTGGRGRASTRPDDNYPGDIQLSPTERVVYLANRGYDTIAVVDAVGSSGRLAEVDAGVEWPQHLFVSSDELIIAGSGSSTVAAISLEPLTGMPIGEARVLFECPRPVWMIADPYATVP